MTARSDGPTPLLRRERHGQRPEGWLTPAERAQLERDLDDLPDLADQLHAHYQQLLAAGDRNPDDRSIRYPIDTQPLDLASSSRKGNRMLLDPIGEADLARRIGARRHGLQPTLESWVVLADSEMWDTDIEHTEPADHPTVTTETGWLRMHLDWITAQQWVVELASEIRALTADLVHLVGPAYARPDDETVGTIPQLAAWCNVGASTIYRWAKDGHLNQAGVDDFGRRQYFTGEVMAVKASRVSNLTRPR